MPNSYISIGGLGAALLGIVLAIANFGSFNSSAHEVLDILRFGSSIRLPLNPEVFDTHSQVTYRGTREGNVEHFRNVFFAEDTSGKNRFAPPVPLVYTPGTVVDATTSGAWCPQALGDVLPFTSKVVNVSENCLSLQIARPSGTRSDERLPVIVYIHGGGNMLGSGAEKLYRPDGLIEQSVTDKQPSIFVAINYRLGIFGYANTTALYNAKHTNIALRDQRAALEWVRDHIRSFGGDSDNVTAIGQSAGASDVGLHLLSYRGSQGVPFQRAHMMSGSPGVVFNVKSSIVAENTINIARQLGCDDAPESEAIVECLRSLPLDKLRNASVSAAQARYPPFGELYFFPYVDDDYITDRPSLLLRQRNVVRDIPLTVSWVTNDAAWYASPGFTTDVEINEMHKRLVPGLSDSTLKQFLSLYPLSGFESMVRSTDGPISPQYYRAAQMTTDLFFTCPSLDYAFNYAKHSGGARANVRLYEHNATRYEPIWSMMGVPMWRVAHLSDIPYLLNGNVDFGDNSEEQVQLSRLLSSSMVSFASTGNPTALGSSLESWPVAFSNVNNADFEGEHMSSLNVALFGGPHGSGSVTLSADPERAQSDAQRAFNDRNIFERCKFINSELFRQEADV